MASTFPTDPAIEAMLDFPSTRKMLTWDGTEFCRRCFRSGCPKQMKKLFTCEIRWPYARVDWERNYADPIHTWRVEGATVGGTTDKMVTALVKQAADHCAAYMKQINAVSIVFCDDTWKPVQNQRSLNMQRLFTIEIRVDFRDEEKLPLMQEAIRQAARHVYAQAALLGEAVKPEVVIYSHDYFSGHSDIALFDDDIANGSAAITEAGNSALTAGPAVCVTGATGAPVAKDEIPFSQELVDALK